MVDVRLYALLDPERAGGHDLAALGREVVAGGATLVQLRDKHGSTRRLIEETRAIKTALAGSGVPVLVNSPPAPTACTSGRTTCRPPRHGGCSGAPP
jgi:thiamine monophosphate synthase